MHIKVGPNVEHGVMSGGIAGVSGQPSDNHPNNSSLQRQHAIQEDSTIGEDICIQPGYKHADSITKHLNAVVDRRRHTDPGAITIELAIVNATNQGIVDNLKLNTTMNFKWKNQVVMGRGVDVDIFLSDNQISRNHLALTGQILPDGSAHFTVQNMSSSKPIYVNGREIPARSREIISIISGDQITVVNITFRLKISSGIVDQAIGFKLLFAHKEPVVSQPAYTNGWYNATSFHSSGEGAYMLAMVPVQGVVPTTSIHVPGGIPFFPQRGFQQVLKDAHVLLEEYHNDAEFVTKSHLGEIAQRVVTKCKNLARILMVPEHLIESTCLNYPNNWQEVSWQLLLKWVQLNPTNFKYTTLGQALCHDTVGRDDLAKLYCNYSKENDS